MKTHLNAGDVAVLLTNYRSGRTSRNFSHVLTYFKDTIKEFAQSYPESWRDDFIQEGTLGLLKALETYPESNPSTDFVYYAITAIKSKMRDFWRTTFSKSIVNWEDVDLEGNRTQTAAPVFVDVEQYRDQDGETVNIIENLPFWPDYETSLTTAIDVRYTLVKAIQNPAVFTETERKIIQLHHTEGCSVTETAQYLHISISSASKKIAKTNTKIKYILSS